MLLVTGAGASRNLHRPAEEPIVLMDGRLANETRSLFKLGVVRDAHRIAAGLIAAQAVGSEATGVLCRDADAHLVHPDGRLERSAISASA